MEKEWKFFLIQDPKNRGEIGGEVQRTRNDGRSIKCLVQGAGMIPTPTQLHASATTTQGDQSYGSNRSIRTATGKYLLPYPEGTSRKISDHQSRAPRWFPHQRGVQLGKPSSKEAHHLKLCYNLFIKPWEKSSARPHFSFAGSSPHKKGNRSVGRRPKRFGLFVLVLSWLI